MLYDKVKMEMSAFKAAVSAKYKEHLEMLRALPDTAPMDPKHMAEVISAAVDKAPSAESFIEDAEVKNNVKTEVKPEPAEEMPANEGFKVADEPEEQEEE